MSKQYSSLCAFLAALLLMASLSPKLALGLQPTPASDNGEINRVTDLSPIGTVTLGEPLGTLTALGDSLGPHSVYLPVPAQNILSVIVELDEKELVQDLIFIFDKTTNIHATVAGYSQKLGTPEMQTPDEFTLAFTWKDKQTQLDLVKRTVDGESRVFSVLSDLTSTSKFAPPEPTQVDYFPLSATTDDIVETSKIWEVINELKGQATTLIFNAYPSLSPNQKSEIEEQANKHLAPSLLYSDVIAYFDYQANDEIIAMLVDVFLEEQHLAIHKKLDSTRSDLPFEEFAQQPNTFSPQKLKLIKAFVESNRATEFFMRMTDELFKMAKHLESPLQDNGKSLIPVIPDSHKADQYVQVYQLATLSFGQQFKAATEEEISHLLTASQTEIGQWYTMTYINAVMYAIRQAGERIKAAQQ